MQQETINSKKETGMSYYINIYRGDWEQYRKDEMGDVLCCVHDLWSLLWRSTQYVENNKTSSKAGKSKSIEQNRCKI